MELTRELYAEKNEDNPFNNIIGNRLPTPVPDINQPQYYRASTFPQPAVIGMGYVTSAGAKGTFFLPSLFTVAKGATGVYTITHNIGSVKYIPIINLQDSASKNFTVTVNANDTVIRTFTSNTAAAVDTAFMFVFYLNP